jgi:hypothetical protein
MKFTPDSHQDDWHTFLQRHEPKDRTSTWRPDSHQSILGEAAEIVVRDRLQRVLDRKGLNWKALRRMDEHHPNDPRNAIGNSNEGDVHVIDHRGKRRLAFEVKASQTWPNAAISESELLYSEADYLVGVTTAGLWVCTMEEARRVSQKKTTYNGTFYLIPQDRVFKLTLDDLFRDT